MRGDRVRELRRAGGKTQRQLAREVGVAQGHISLIEAGQSEPSIDLLLRLAGSLKTTSDYLLGLSDEEGSSELQPAELALV